MATPTPAQPTVSKDMQTVMDCMKDIQSEDDLWELADALKVLIPTGSSGFDKVIDQATTDGVVGKFKPETLRRYRDAAAKWPTDKRVEKVSFTAHREAMPLGSIDAAKRLLEGMAKAPGGPGKVSAVNVRKAVASQNQGSNPTTTRTRRASGGAAGQQSPVVNVLNDVKAGGQTLIQSIQSGMPSSELNELKQGFNKVLTHIERLLNKATAKAQQSPKKAAPVTQAPAKAAADTQDGEKKEPELGDLRGA